MFGWRLVDGREMREYFKIYLFDFIVRREEE